MIRIDDQYTSYRIKNCLSNYFHFILNKVTTYTDFDFHCGFIIRLFLKYNYVMFDYVDNFKDCLKKIISLYKNNLKKFYWNKHIFIYKFGMLSSGEIAGFDKSDNNQIEKIYSKKIAYLTDILEGKIIINIEL